MKKEYNVTPTGPVMGIGSGATGRRDGPSFDKTASFAERIAVLEKALASPIGAFETAILPVMLACIREQQAALKRIAEMDYSRAATNGCAYMTHVDAKTTLAKWKLP